MSDEGEFEMKNWEFVLTCGCNFIGGTLLHIRQLIPLALILLLIGIPGGIIVLCKEYKN